MSLKGEVRFQMYFSQKSRQCDAIRSYSNDRKHIRKRVPLLLRTSRLHPGVLRPGRGFDEMPAGDCDRASRILYNSLTHG